MIPKIIHYVWVGSPFPERYQHFIDSWRKHNPDFLFLLWNERNIDFTAPVVKELYDARKFNKVSDLVRHTAVAEMGGIYLDTDFLVFKSLHSLLGYDCFYGFQHEHHPNDWVAPGAFGAVPGHWFVRKVLDRMLASKNSFLGLDIPTALGPKLITSMLRAEGLNHYSADGVMVSDIFLCPTHWFYPFGMDEEYTEACIRPDTLMAHFWERSWEATMSPSTRMVRAVRSTIRRMIPRVVQRSRLR